MDSKETEEEKGNRTNNKNNTSRSNQKKHGTGNYKKEKEIEDENTAE